MPWRYCCHRVHIRMRLRMLSVGPAFNAGACTPRRQAALLRGAEAGNLTVLDKTFHAFSPHGITGMLVSYSEASQSRARFADLRASARKW